MRTLTEFIEKFITFINTTLVPLVFAVAFIVFLYGVYKYFILGGASEEKRTEGRKYIVYAVIGFAVMMSVWGLVNVVINTFGFDSNSRPCLPTFSGGCTSSDSGNRTGTPTNLLPTQTPEPTDPATGLPDIY